jgi:LacI family transcriptional regulator
MTTLSSGDGDAVRPRATMRDVAALAGVSLKTVSRVINGEAGVSPALAARVTTAVEQLDFRPNLGASNLRRTDGRTRTIGLLVNDVANPFSSALHRGVEDVARARGVALLAASLDEDADRERQLAAALAARRVDGLIVTPTSADHSYLHTERRAGTAVVFVDRVPSGIEADCVVVDNEEGAAGATHHLLAHGHRAIAFLGDLAEIGTERQRHDGFVRALREAGAPVLPALVRHDLHSIEAAEREVSAMLDSATPPTAIFAAQNLLTIGAIRALRARDLHRSIALVGFDDFLLADLLEPAVTVVAQDPARIGSLAAELLFARLDGDSSPPATHVVPTRLVVRGSGEIPGP